MIFENSGGAGLLCKDGRTYPGLQLHNGIYAHPPVTLLNVSEVNYLVDWCNKVKLQQAKINTYCLAILESTVLSYWLYEEVSPTVDDIYRDTGLHISQTHIDRLCERYRSTPYEKLIKQEEEIYATEVRLAKELINWYVQSFVRVRDGGMFHNRGLGTVYFRISSAGYDWTSVIKRFCEDTFGVDSNQRIWVGLDEDNRGSSRRYFEGTVKKLLSDNLEYEVWANTQAQKPKRQLRKFI